MVMVSFTILFLQQLLFRTLIFGRLIEGDCLMEVQLHLQIFEQNGFSLCYQSWPVCKGHSTTFVFL